MTERLPFEIFLGLRYLRARGQRANLSLFVWIGLGGVFLGVAALIVVLAVMTGFQRGIRDKIIAANPHVLIFEASGRGVPDAAALAGRARGLAGVKAVTPFVLQQALFTGPGGGARGGLLRGVDFRAAGAAADIRSQLRTGDLAALERGEPAILLGRELARSLGVAAGDAITAISPQGALTAVGMVPRMRRYVVAGTLEVGMYEYDSTIAYVALATAQEFAGLGDRVTGVEVKLDDPEEAPPIARALAARLGWPYWVRDWTEMNKNLFAALQLEKLALFVVLAIIVLVAGFAIIGHLVLLVAEKRKEIGILKALGASGRSITAVFFGVGMTIGIIGTTAGSAAGLAIMWVQNTYKIIRLAGDVYQIDYLPMRLTVSDFFITITTALAISFLATIFPARRAGALLPAEVLRYE